MDLHFFIVTNHGCIYKAYWRSLSTTRFIFTRRLSECQDIFKRKFKHKSRASIPNQVLLRCIAGRVIETAMEKQIVLIGIPGSSLVDELVSCLGRTDSPYCTLSLDAPLEGKPVTVAPGAVMWEGVDLLHADAVFVERPVFPWPQMLLPTGRFQDFDHEQWVVFQREASSLTVSAILAAAEVRPVINPPASAHLAVSPSIALDRLAREGILVHPWSLEPAPPRDRAGAGFVLDACWLDRWHSPTRPRVGEPSLVLEPFPGEVVSFIVVGGKSAGALRYPSGASWAESYEMNEACESRKRVGTIAGENGPELLDTPGPVPEADGPKPLDAPGSIPEADVPEPLSDPESFPEAADLANLAAAALGLGFAAVSIRTGVSPNSVLLCEAGPDLSAWNRILGGRLATALADHLTCLSSKQQRSFS